MTIEKEKKVRKSNKSLRTKIIVLVAVVSVITLLAAFFSSYMVIKFNRNDYDNNCNREFSEIENRFKQKYSTIQRIMTACSYDQDVQRVLGGNETLPYEIMSPIGSMETRVLQLIYYYSTLDEDIVTINLVDRQNRKHSYLHYSDEIEFNSFTSKNMEDKKSVVSSMFVLGGKRCFAIKQPIISSKSERTGGEISDNFIGYIVIAINGDFLEKSLLELSEDDRNVVITDSDGKIMFGENEILGMSTQDLCKIQKSMQEKNENMTKNGENIIMRKAINEEGWNLVLVTKSLNRDFYNKNIFIYIGVSWIFVLVIIAYLSWNLIKYINGFVYKLLIHMEDIGRGNLTSRISYDEIVEFKEIEQGLNDMMSDVLYLTNQNIELSTAMYCQQKEQLQTTLLALQSQMNPHFLYNTMECIKNIGICYNVREIENIAASLSDIFRYSLNNESIVSLRQEIICIENFMMIQNIRFEDKFKIIYEIDPSLLRLRIMRLTLEPLVENAIYHAFDNKVKNCKVKISVYEDKNKIYMKVNDNGSGMSASVIHNIMEGYENPDNNNVALKNLIRRLKIYYQEQVDFSIESIIDEGTIVSIAVDYEFYNNKENLPEG